MESIFKINVNDEYKPLLEDIIKVFVILTVTDILNFMANNSKKKKKICYLEIIIGIYYYFYWLEYVLIG